MRRINILKVLFDGKDKIESCHCVCKFTGNYVSVGGFNLHLLLTLNGCIANQLNQVFVNYSKFCITTELTVYAIAKWHCLNAPSVEILKNRSLPFRFELKNRLQNNSKIRRFLSKVDCCTSLQCRLPKWVVQRRQRVLNSAARLLRQLHNLIIQLSLIMLELLRFLIQQRTVFKIFHFFLRIPQWIRFSL